MIPVSCECGEYYELKDAVAGRRVRCFTCDRLMDVPVPARLAARAGRTLRAGRGAPVRKAAGHAAAGVAVIAALVALSGGTVMAAAHALSTIQGPAIQGAQVLGLSVTAEGLAGLARTILALTIQG